MNMEQKSIAGFAVAIMMVAVIYALVPFRFADTVPCSAPLLGSRALSLEVSSKGLIKPVEDCLRKGRSRLIVSASAAFMAIAAGVAFVMTEPELPWWLSEKSY
ncbi:MAG: hypothetical protein ACT4OS_11315 [Acidimicrobiales bacterium]